MLDSAMGSGNLGMENLTSVSGDFGSLKFPRPTLNFRTKMHEEKL